MTLPAIKTQFLPHNRQEHDNDIRALIGRHMGNDFSNPTQWVVDAVHEAFRIAFSMGFEAGQTASWSGNVEATVQPRGVAPGRIEQSFAKLPMVERVEDRDIDIDDGC